LLDGKSFFVAKKVPVFSKFGRLLIPVALPHYG
jgi:hypothetical protein